MTDYQPQLLHGWFDLLQSPLYLTHSILENLLDMVLQEILLQAEGDQIIRLQTTGEFLDDH